MNRLRILLGLFLACLAVVSVPAQQAALATVTGRVQNAATGDYLEGVRVRVAATGQETFTDADGFYRLDRLPPGGSRLEVFFSGFPAQTSTVTLAAGAAAVRDLAFGTAPRTDAAGTVVQLSQFVVATSREMSGAAFAINEQRFAPNIKNVVATDEFGDVAEGNAAEFLKFLPGVNIDYAGGNARDVSLNGVPGDYVPVTLDGFGLASAVGGGAGGTNRSVGLDQVSINNLSRIEVSFSPTPDSQGNALAGSVNLVPRSSFERAKPVFNFST